MTNIGFGEVSSTSDWARVIFWFYVKCMVIRCSWRKMMFIGELAGLIQSHVGLECLRLKDNILIYELQPVVLCRNIFHFQFWRARVVRWWECSPFQCGPDSIPGPGVICRLSGSLLLGEVFLQILRFSSLLKKWTFLNSYSIWNPGATGLLPLCDFFLFIYILLHCSSGNPLVVWVENIFGRP